MESVLVELKTRTSRDTNYLLTEIDNLDFHLLKIKLQDNDDGEGWTLQQCNEAEVLYKRFLKLILLYPKEKLVPNKAIDTFWHYHILDTRHYIKTTEGIFGEYIHHYPYLGLFGEDDRKKLTQSFNNTLELYRNTFNEELSQTDFSKCDNDGGGESTCAGRCNRD